MERLAQDPILANSEVRSTVLTGSRLLRDALPEGSFEQRERAALALANEMVREVVKAELVDLVAELEADAVEVDGRRYEKHQPGSVVYHSLCGPVEICRYTYRDAQVRNGPTVVPMELAAGLVERATPMLAKALVRGYAVNDSRGVEEDLIAAARVPPSRATIERMDRAVGELASAKVVPIEASIRRTETLPKGTCGVVMGLDRTSAPMLERPEGPPIPSKQRKKPLLRRSSGSYAVVFRMAYVGTVSFVDEHGEALEVRRYAAPACDDPRELIPRMTADIEAALKRNPALRVGTLQDGAHEMWNRTREGMAALKQKGLIEQCYEGIDRYHLMERLGKALKIVEPKAKVRAGLMAQWNDRLDQDDGAIDDIETYFKTHYLTVSMTKAEELWEHLVYLKNNKDRMRYVTLRATGMPCGSGVTESAAKTVIGERANCSGQRWGESGLRAALTVRAVLLSNRFPAFWRHLARRYTARVELAA